MNEKKRMTPQELVSAFLDATSRMSQPEQAEALGVTHTTIGRWHAGYGKPRGWKGLQAGTQRKLEDYLEGHTNTNEGDAPPYNEEREEVELARIGAIPDPLLRTMERESIAAVIRAQSMRDACRAARIEAEKAPDRSSVKAQILWTEEKMAADLDRMLRARAAAAERGAGTG